ncbi:hypothetical protein SD10_17900 [Spirosoma radiotolerans]|uniref:TonB C-terminal domain-containing protein n=1 Tax=Spirosoma radiotolerans TaxID=1379870 RepID=A0A0E3VAT0_9BACT|nr:hypothetical protein SD10_17900 [Spirosoma radiotolerans]
MRLILLLCMLSMPYLTCRGQIFVYQEKDGNVFTSVDDYSPGMTSTYTRTTYMGSPFLTFPVWQPGKIRLDMEGRTVDCQLAYNLNTNEVLCRFDGDSAIKTVTPEFFSINNTEYVRQQNKLAGMDYRMYFSTVHSGPTKLLKSLSNQLTYMNSAEQVNMRHYKDLNLRGIYRTVTKYFVQKENAEPTLISFSRKSLLDVLADQSEALADKIPNRELTTSDVINILNYYDLRVAEARQNRAHLSKEEVFREILQNKINYPGWVGNQGIYGRVYAGFDVDSLGLVRNVVILSPDNMGFGFTFEVKRALETLSNIDPHFRGAYALPIAFTFTNSKENSGPHIPTNRLPEDRYQNRTLLEEVTIPFVVAKSSVVPREVWGYYK